MKILLFYTYNQGYLSGFFTEIAKRLSQEGHEVICFSLKSRKIVLQSDNVLFHIDKRGGYLKTYMQIFQFIKKSSPDIILSNFSYVNPALLFGKLLGVRNNMVWFHSLNEQMEPTSRNIFIKKQFLRLADIVVANSHLTAQELHTIYKVPISSIECIAFWSTIHEQKPNLSDSKYLSTAKILKIGCPGRLVAHKNQQVVIKALAQLKQTHPSPFHLYLAGTGEAQEDLMTLSRELGISNEVSFMGHLSADEMVSFYQSMDVVVLPSLHEAFGLVFIEAISLSTPVIVSSQFGALSFIDDNKYDQSKFTFDPESSEQLANHLISYMEHRGLSKGYFKELYEKTFDKERIYEQIKEIILY